MGLPPNPAGAPPSFTPPPLPVPPADPVASDAGDLSRYEQYCVELHDHLIQYYKPFHDVMKREARFVWDMEQYSMEVGQILDRRRVQFKSQKLQNLIRHKVAKICQSELYYECDSLSGDDPLAEETSAAAKWALDSQIYDDLKDFFEIRDTMVEGALVCRAWGMGVEWVESAGAFGEILFRDIPGWRLMAAPGVKNLHSLYNPYAMEIFDLKISEIEARGRDPESEWQNTEGLIADGGSEAEAESTTPTDLPIRELTQMDIPRPGPGRGPRRDGVVRCAKLWFRNDPWNETSQRETLEPLPAEQRYMACLGEPGGEPGCGYEDRSEDPNQQPDGSYLPASGFSCPQCGKTLQRVDAKRITDTLRSGSGRRLVIFAPKLRRVFYSGDWPHGRKLRTYPYAYYVGYRHGLYQIGGSDTQRNHSLIVVDNAIMQQAYTSMRLNPNVLVMLKGAFEDAHGNSYKHTDEQGNIAFATTIQALDGAKMFTGAGLPGGFSEIKNHINNEFYQNSGTSDFNAPPGQTRNIPVGSIEAQIRESEIPIDHHIARLQQQLSMILMSTLDIAADAWTSPRSVFYKDDLGNRKCALLRGTDLPSVRVRVTAKPNLKNMNVGSWNAINQFLQLPPEAQKTFAKYLNISSDDVQQIQMERQRIQADQFAQQQRMAAMTPSAGSPEAGAPPAQPAPPQPRTVDGSEPTLEQILGGPPGG